MTLVYEKGVGEDLNLGTGTTTITNPGGGSLSGTQISLSTFSIGGANASAVTTTWDPASVLAAQSTTTTLTVTGAALGNFVLCSFSNSLQGCVLSAYVSEANTVTAVIMNPTTSVIDLLSGTLTVLVFAVR